jgi:antitoxin component of MazEF toxin-antitoxin module
VTRHRETTVTDEFVPLPAAVRESADIQPGDTVRWQVHDDGRLSLEVVEERRGAFDDFEPFETDEPVDGVEAKHTTGVDE